MNKVLPGLLVAVMCALPVLAQAAKESYTIDPDHTYPNFKINHLGYSTMYGRFGKTSGSITLDRETMVGSVEITIDAASVDTGMKKRDDHLRGADFFNAVEFPEITYQAKNAQLNKDGSGKVKGTLTIMGVSKAVTLDVQAMNCKVHPFDKTKQKFVCGFDATATINRTEFGINYGSPLIGDEVELMFEVEAQRN